jgi:hypothetical protein
MSAVFFNVESNMQFKSTASFFNIHFTLNFSLSQNFFIGINTNQDTSKYLKIFHCRLSFGTNFKFSDGTFIFQLYGGNCFNITELIVNPCTFQVSKFFKFQEKPYLIANNLYISGMNFLLNSEYEGNLFYLGDVSELCSFSCCNFENFSLFLPAFHTPNNNGFLFENCSFKNISASNSVSG